VGFSPDGSIVYVGGHYGIHALQTADGQQVGTWSVEPSKAFGSPVTRVAASPDGRFLAAGTDLPDGQVYLLEARTGKLVTSWAVTTKGDGGGSTWSLRPKKTIIQGLAFSPGGKLLATADSLSASVRIWEMPQESGAKSRFAWLRRK
jgi:WD40 repeat protein